VTWPCRLVDFEKSPKAVGDMWFAPWINEDSDLQRYYCSPEYHRDWLGKRAPLMVRLPNGVDWIVDSPMRGQPGASGWTVTGEAPSITVMPSINFFGSYHGWLQNGVLSDDVEGRRFPALEGD
jgi:hypothetical protein